MHVKFQAFCSIPSAIEEEAGKTKIHQNGFVLSLLMLVPLTKSIIQRASGQDVNISYLSFYSGITQSGNDRPQLPSSLLELRHRHGV